MRIYYCAIIISISVFVFMSACSAQPKTAPKADNVGDKNSNSADSSNKTGQAEKKQADFTINDETGLPEGWRDDIPLMQGMKVVRFNSSEETMNAFLKGDVPIDEVFKFYSNIEGWERDKSQEESLKDEENLKGIVFKKDGKQLTIAMYVADNQTNMNIVVQPADDAGK